MVTTIGIDPHKATHTATAINDTEQILGEVTVAADQTQVKRLVLWADQLGTNSRVWAVESAGGLGSLLAQQLLAAGESVVGPRFRTGRTGIPVGANGSASLDLATSSDPAGIR